jgi:hypothetical protein
VIIKENTRYLDKSFRELLRMELIALDRTVQILRHGRLSSLEREVLMLVDHIENALQICVLK